MTTELPAAPKISASCPRKQWSPRANSKLPRIRTDDVISHLCPTVAPAHRSRRDFVSCPLLGGMNLKSHEITHKRRVFSEAIIYLLNEFGQPTEQDAVLSACVLSILDVRASTISVRAGAQNRSRSLTPPSAGGDFRLTTSILVMAQMLPDRRSPVLAAWVPTVERTKATTRRDTSSTA